MVMFPLERKVFRVKYASENYKRSTSELLSKLMSSTKKNLKISRAHKSKRENQNELNKDTTNMYGCWGVFSLWVIGGMFDSPRYQVHIHTRKHI